MCNMLCTVSRDDIDCIQSAEEETRALVQVPKDSKVIVACQKGLRSLAACEQLNRAGYKDIAWINGGFDNSTKVCSVSTSRCHCEKGSIAEVWEAG
jgi:rhodanese-related sulfurtransferase